MAIVINGSGTVTGISVGGLPDGIVDADTLAAGAAASAIGDLSDGATTATNNVGLGSGAVDSITTGDNNTGIGVNALTATTDGSENVAVGQGALDANTTADGNSALGTNALGSNTTGANNVAVGKTALTTNTTGTQITALGKSALHFNTTGSYNTAVGYESLVSNTTGEYNTAVGSSALDANTTGVRNTAVGRHAATAITTGNYNTALGMSALYSAVTANENTAVGYESLTNNTASGNTAVGKSALTSNTTADSNTAVGKGSLQGVTTGSGNTAIGYMSGYYNSGRPTTGGQNTFLGAYTRASTEGHSAQIVIGYDGIPSQSANTPYAQFNYGTGTWTRVQLGSTSWASSSDERIKEDIQDSTLGLTFIDALRPRSFKFKKEKDILPTTLNSYKEGSETRANGGTETHHYGFIAQEVKAVIDARSDVLDNAELWSESIDGTQAIAQGALIPILVKAIQELSAKNDALEARITTLEG